MYDILLLQALANEWVSLLFQYGLRDILASAYNQCGLPCFVSKTNELYLSVQLLDILYRLPDGTSAAFLHSNGYHVRGM